MSHWVDHGVVGFDEPARDEPVGDQFPPRRCSRVILAGNLSALDVELPEPAIDRHLLIAGHHDPVWALTVMWITVPIVTPRRTGPSGCRNRSFPGADAGTDQGVIMRVLVAGATGVIGEQMVPLLAAVGHEVLGLVRPGGDTTRLEATGARVVVADALDQDGLRRAVRQAAPEGVVNMLTAIPAELDPRHLARDFALTNRLRAEATRNLIEGAPGARLISQGLAYGYQPGEGFADEDAPLWRTGTPKQFVPVLDALTELERLTTQAGGLVLRLGHLYGPGSIYAADGSFVQQVRAGKVPLVGGGNAVFSFTHAHDVAGAVVAALGKPEVTGVLNIVDDHPAPLREWLPELAALLGAQAPKKAPAALARLMVGSWGVAFMNQLRGAAGTRARLRLDWRPRYASVTEGFAAELADVTVQAA